MDIIQVIQKLVFTTGGTGALASVLTIATVLMPIIMKIVHFIREGHEKRLLKHQQRLYRQSLEGQREQDFELPFDGNSLVLRGLFYMDNLLKRRCPERKELYLKPLRHYRMTVLKWSTKLAACTGQSHLNKPINSEERTRR